MISLDFQNKIEEYKNIDWDFLLLNDFPSDKNFKNLKPLFYEMKTLFDLVFENLNELEEKIPENELSAIHSRLNALFHPINSIKEYEKNGGFDKKNEIVQQVKRTYVEVKDGLTKFLSYINPEENNKILDELEKIRNIKEKMEAEFLVQKKAIEKMTNELKRGVSEIGIKKGELGSKKLSNYFALQAEEHHKNAFGEKGFLGYFSGWIGKRRLFFWLIFITISVNICLYIFHLNSEEKSIFGKFFSLEYGILSASLVLIFYMGMSFSTNNFASERELEIENKNRANIAETLNLFLAASKKDGEIEIILKDATKTLFSPPQSETFKGKLQSINLPIIDIAKTLQK